MKKSILSVFSLACLVFLFACAHLYAFTSVKGPSSRNHEGSTIEGAKTNSAANENIASIVSVKKIDFKQKQQTKAKRIAHDSRFTAAASLSQTDYFRQTGVFLTCDRKKAIKHFRRKDEKFAQETSEAMVRLYKFNHIFLKAGDEFKVDPNLLKAIAKVESNGRHHDKEGRLLSSPKGALGMMQVKQATARAMGEPDVKSLKGNVRAATKYLQYLAKLGYSLPEILIGYNRGPNKLDIFINSGKNAENDRFVRDVLAAYACIMRMDYA